MSETGGKHSTIPRKAPLYSGIPKEEKEEGMEKHITGKSKMQKGREENVIRLVESVLQLTLHPTRKHQLERALRIRSMREEKIGQLEKSKESIGKETSGSLEETTLVKSRKSAPAKRVKGSADLGSQKKQETYQP